MIPVALVLEPIPVMNLLFSALIVIVGLYVYWKTKNASPLYIAAGFFLFGLSHLATILGVGDVFATPLLVVRVVGYILVIGSLFICYAMGGK